MPRREIVWADDVALSALIDDELPEADAGRIRATLRDDPDVARRFAELTAVTSEVGASYASSIEVTCAVAELHARAIREACRDKDASELLSGSANGRDPRASAAVRPVDRAMANLTSEQRRALSLTVFEQLSYFEIAEALGVLPRTVMQWVGEARSALRAELRGFAPAELPSGAGPSDPSGSACGSGTEV
jgi:hypothetical protein